MKLHYNLEVEILENGGAEKYKDSCFRYCITDKSNVQLNEQEMMQFCLTFLKHAVTKEAQTNWAQTYISRFEKTGQITWIYEVTEPNTN